MRKIFTLLLISSLPGFLFAQKKNEAFQYPIRRAASPIEVDGRMDEPAWAQTAVAGDFYMILPMDTARANVRTEVRMAYDDRNVYILVENFEKLPGPMFVESLKRDFAFGKNDNFLLFIDPFDDQTNGFSFGANAAGAQWDGQMFEGASVNLNWDNKWTSVVKHTGDRWIWEAAIPFKTLRYKKGITRWGINFSRLDLKTTEKSAWAPVPRQFPSAALAYTGVLVWDVPPPDPGPNISLIPYALGGVSANPVGAPAEYRRDVGLDAKIAVTSSLNLDLTVNPDFSQVEVDRQVTNLDRFELFFPERRQFFLENADLFTNVGFATIRPFFSRRIGLGVPIRAGARLSGKLNKDWRIGVLDVQTGAVESTGLPAQNFAVVSLQRRVFARSNIAAIFVNKQSLDYTPEAGKPSYTAYNRNLGLEYNLASPNNVWRGKFLALKSFSPAVKGDDYVQAANLSYGGRHWTLQWQHEYVGKNYTAEVGYVPRRGYFKINPQVSYLFLPAPSSRVLSHGPQLFTTVFWENKTGRVSDQESIFLYTVRSRSQNIFAAWVATSHVRLLAPFDPTNLGRDTLATGSKHYWNAWGTDFISKPQSLFTFSFSSRYGGYYAGGTRLGLNAELGYRFQPYVSLGLAAAYNDIRLPEPLDNARFWLIGPRAEVTFTNKLFWTTFVQYNEQIKNINLNTRLQWRYAPASDLFVVYTDNYLPAPFSVKSRALVLKLTYWWNI